MITYNGLELFSSGPSRVEPGPIESRDLVANTPGAIGGQVITQGQSPRVIKQHGMLVADSQAQLSERIDAIDGQVGLGAATLIDEHETPWAGCVLRVFEPGPIKRLGPRYAVDYTIEYLQSTP